MIFFIFLIVSFLMIYFVSFLTFKSFLNFKNFIIIYILLISIYFILNSKYDSNDLYFLIFVIYILVMQSIIDILTFNVYSIFNYIVIFVSIIFKQKLDLFYLVNSLLFPSIIYILYLIFKDSFGFGDVELIFALSFSLSLNEQALMTLIACFFALLYLFLFKSFRKTNLYFVPFISLAYFIIKIKEISIMIFLT